MPLIGERVWEFRDRHQVIDRLRGQRESGESFAIDVSAVGALLQEIDLLQVIAQAAEHVAAFPDVARAGEPVVHLRNSLRRWKE
jgi:hypothetical protein